ncbi:autotransporter outer membrane beta-barrel domain-containing protein [Pragia fontium]|uniref:Outer membrane autotransporter barrel domain-containing protein n=1 Tax=Pragia fontium DSM 5563 = ATCC 49100 TaxID=1122977 RepID=A0AAJ4WC73_9GAMM|nr:autotransporter outer membrane beta-barrel domain-containing protein [Pragia fontium]SFD16374.1 outer membrane autotransporter barrel domain-containing protein [Pragia fontium DSM 5563 = ATCC 49100]VEJ52799.1 Adhesin/invasin TibA autotransporter precursor [Pragia fontium]
MKRIKKTNLKKSYVCLAVVAALGLTLSSPLSYARDITVTTDLSDKTYSVAKSDIVNVNAGGVIGNGSNSAVFINGGQLNINKQGEIRGMVTMYRKGIPAALNINEGVVKGSIYIHEEDIALAPIKHLTINKSTIIDNSGQLITVRRGYLNISGSEIINEQVGGLGIELQGNWPASVGAGIMNHITDSKVSVKGNTAIFNGYNNLSISGTEINVSGSGQFAIGLSAGAGIAEVDANTFLNKSKINSDGIGARFAGGKAYISGSEINAKGDSGITTVGGSLKLSEKSVVNANSDAIGLYVSYIDNNIIIDNSTINAENNASIVVAKDAVADIQLQNDASLTSGTNTILNVMDNATVNFGVDNSAISGGIAATENASLNVTLQNNSSFSGHTENVKSITIDEQSRWSVEKDSSASNVNNNGQIVFSSLTSTQRSLPFSRLDMENLSGNGSFAMRVEGASGDFLNVTETTQGKHTVYLSGSGSEGSDGYHLIHAKGGVADSFALSNGVVELGTYQYSLKQSNDDWYLTLGNDPKPDPTPDPTEPNSKPRTSTSTDAVLSMAAANQFIFDGEMQGLGKGGLNTHKGNNGNVWGRYLTNNTRIHTSGNAAFKLQQDGLQIGGDKTFELSSGALLAGVFTSYTDNTVKHARGGRSNIDSYALGVYLTYFDNIGYYIDSVIKGNRFNNDMKARMVNGDYATADYHQNAIGGALEAGYHYDITDAWFTEPYVRGSYFTAESKDIELNNGMKANTGNNRSARGELGAIVGTKFSLQNGSEIRPYARLAIEREFIKHNTVTINDTNDFNNNLSGNSGKYGAGVDININDNTSVYAEANYRQGGHVESPIMGNVGFRIAF